MSELAVMDRDKGDNKIEWNPGNKDQVEIARAAFDAAKAKGYLAYTLDESGHRGEVIRRFDPSAERIIMSPQPIGG
jgi:hypothetical protein